MSSADAETKSLRKPRRYPSALRLVALFLVLLAAGVTVVLVRSRTGEIPYRGGVVRIPLRTGSFQVMVSEGRARYLLPGQPEIKSLLAERGTDLGWRFQDQLGAMYVIASTRGDGLRVVMVTEQVMSRFVQVDCHIEADVPLARAVGASPPSQ